MRLVQKLSLAFMLGTTTILAARGYFRVRRDVAVFQADRVRDHDLIGRALGAAVEAVWRTQGRTEAMALIDAANGGERRVQIKWIWLDGSALHVDASDVAHIPRGSTLTRIAPDDRGQAERYTYVPVATGAGPGGLELSETLDAEREYTQSTIVDTVRTTLVLAVVTTVLSYVLGFWLVGRPVRQLVDKARRIGRGDFAGPVRLTQRDELAFLADEMNATSDALVEANDRVARETAARIAALEQLRHADRLNTVGKLASGVAHELGTPLNVIGARAEMIAAGETTPEEAREYARIVVDSARRMTQIIRQLLDFARRRGPRKETRDLAPITKHAIELLRPLAQRQHVDLTLASAGSECAASVDPAQIEQALTNLVVNAVQASPQGAVVDVRVGARRAVPPADLGGAEREWLAVDVYDRGRGIDAEVLPHVFEPFFTTKDVGSGTGLGLSVAYSIARDHGGWIAVETQSGLGSVFTLFLPPERAA
jgi:two-component system NtrC family sensor kinase